MPSPKRIGRQTPTRSHVLPYQRSAGEDAVDSYEESGRTAQEWQKLLLYDILAKNPDKLYTHQRFGYSLPRRNGKNEVVTAREKYGLEIGERILHTAHRTTTSTSAAERLVKLLNESGYTEVQRAKKDEVYTKSFTFSRQKGLEKVTLLDPNGGTCSFRTRTGTGGLGEGFDLLIIDEAQEYTDDQESALLYVVTDSANPQTIMCGTPPTAVSGGTVFPRLRRKCLEGKTEDTGWAEWGIDEQSDPRDVDLWYQTNPSLGSILTERKIRAELSGDALDFNIQRLGLWSSANLKTEISAAEWKELAVTSPALDGPLYIAVKYGRSGENVVLAVAVKLKSGGIFVEDVGCRPQKEGNQWILNFLQKVKKSTSMVAVDGANAATLAKEMMEMRLGRAVLPKVSEIIEANSGFEQAIAAQSVHHGNQPSLVRAITSTEKRAIGTNGGFGYQSTIQGAESALIDAVVLAHWACATGKPARKQRVGY